MKTKALAMRILTNPFPYICFITAAILLLNSLAMFGHYHTFFLPVLIWNTASAAVYVTITLLLHKKNTFLLYMFYIIESCLRIAYSITITKCDPKFEILLISFFIICYLFSNVYKTNKKFFILSLTVISLTIIHTFFYKFQVYISKEELTPPQLLYTRITLFSNITITCIQLILISLNSSISLMKMRIKNESTQKKLEYITCHDTLTGLMNRYLALSFFTTCESRKANESIEYAIAILDIDDFKKINDTYGHDCGDFVLKSYTHELKSKLDPQTAVARWGGEEFLIIFPRISSETVFELDTIRELLSLSPFYYNGQIIHVSATYGMSSSKHWNSAIEVLNDADKNLLIGKQNGKNRLVVSQKF